ncbi:MAG TPA: MgtC/SapB family protein [Gemmatimonadales bacterium]|nr:MgtC/SapB family protein [Gemmatimonadales bacterium]
MPYVPDALSIDSPEFWTRLMTAILCGGVIGLERQIRGKASGIRTSIMICLGTSIFVSLGATAERADPTRVLGQVVTGIGFLGAGVILTREGRILGVTTAALIWVTAAIGCVIGFGYVKTALVLTALTIAVLLGVEFFEGIVERRLVRSQLRERESAGQERRKVNWGRRSGDVGFIPDDRADQDR